MNRRIIAWISALMIFVIMLATSAYALAESETTAQPEATAEDTSAPAEATSEPANESLAFTAVSYDVVMSEYRIDNILKTLPEDLDISRVMLVLRAYALEDNVNYYWGGKSDCIGWDERWGICNVEVDEDGVMGPDDPYGMDCSGFIRWCFINASCSRSFGAGIGRSTDKQWENSVEISMDELIPGDLVFRQEPTDEDTANHVGIIVETGEERTMVIHCGRRGVKLDKLENTNLNVARRPLLLMDEELNEFHNCMENRIERPAMRDYRYIMETRAAEAGAEKPGTD